MGGCGHYFAGNFNVTMLLGDGSDRTKKESTGACVCCKTNQAKNVVIGFVCENHKRQPGPQHTTNGKVFSSGCVVYVPQPDPGKSSQALRWVLAVATKVVSVTPIPPH